MKNKKTTLSHYPYFFFLKAIFSTISWLVFIPLFIFAGKKYLKTDILGNIYHSIFSKKKSFGQYFIGTSEEEKIKLLNYAFWFILIIIGLNVISLLINRYLWKKDKYIENNNFYLHNKWIFIINSLIHVACAFLLTFSFFSAFTVILTLLFISFNTWIFFPPRKIKNPQTETFFSWKNEYVRKIILYSVIVIFVVPLIISYYQRFHQEAMGSAPEGFAEAYQELINTSPAAKGIANVILKTNYSLFHWFILVWFARGLINRQWKEYGNFWTKINSIEKKVTDFRHYYYYQASWALNNNISINLGDYNYLENSPNFLSKSYLEKHLDINDFAKQNQKTVKYIEFCAEKIKEPAKKNFLNYCLFNEFSLWNDCLRTKKLINEVWK